MLTVLPNTAKNLLFPLFSREGRWALLAAGLVVCGYCALTFHREAPTPLPAPVAQRVEQHRIQNAIDSAEIKRLTKAAALQHVKADTATDHSRVAANSGNYRRAYVLEDSAVLALDRQVALLDVALTKSETRAIQADSVIAAVLPIAEARQPSCRVLWFVPCPTRRAAAVAAVAMTSVAFIALPRMVHP